MSLPSLARALRTTATTYPAAVPRFTPIPHTFTRSITTTQNNQAQAAASRRPNSTQNNNNQNQDQNQNNNPSLSPKPTSINTTGPNNNNNNNNNNNTPQKITPNLTTTGLHDQPLSPLPTPETQSQYQTNEDRIDWTRSFHGLSAEPFPKEAADILLAPTDPEEVEIKPDGILYLPEIKYRRILNRAFGPGGWGLVPRSESIVTPKMVTREYALVCHGRLVSVARGEQDYFSPDGIPTATEGCRSNALVRCCKDLGIASELWDPRWIRKFKAQHTREAFVEHVVNKRKSKIWVRKDDEVSYPWKETK
ncbi:putative mitochondrial genome maintenance protein Mgm101 [Aspergillus saccharolyticus JOP 1030-1]|uniref:Mitochondrial genome maintenance protein MGM101 n=1 Tax=Aspergillus saccharolyticus JOP 1030-1 TaxID=1450539 RepID=A0A318ZJ92_9EURO|nr:Mgm101p-domain-containing protein [Aspergillus saccharolyticus JOP 1030-1]PYH47641.1 Mgm101p-domain-containing protein [Aspergillus saccharolyticus JOP 1030-1]